jgi:hypothetical protein
MEGGSSYKSAGERVWRSDGRRFDPWAWCWQAAPSDVPVDARAVDTVGALAAVTGAPGARRLPVGVIGPREASEAQLATAEELGRALGGLGLTTMCGGKGGVMEAVCRGAKAAGGLTVGVLPDSDWRGANAYVDLPIATGLSEARNAVIAKASVALIAVGGSYGTLTEVAYGLHFGKTVLGLCDPPSVEGLERVPDVAGAIARLAEGLLGGAPVSSS